MVFIGIKCLDSSIISDIKFIVNAINVNAEKPVAKTLFRVKSYKVDNDIIVINKVFIPEANMKLIILCMIIISAFLYYFFNSIVALIILSIIYSLIIIFSSSFFNYYMFSIMLRKMGYFGKTKLL
jgi:hypothetical protein